MGPNYVESKLFKLKQIKYSINEIINYSKLVEEAQKHLTKIAVVPSTRNYLDKKGEAFFLDDVLLSYKKFCTDPSNKKFKAEFWDKTLNKLEIDRLGSWFDKGSIVEDKIRYLESNDSDPTKYFQWCFQRKETRLWIDWYKEKRSTIPVKIVGSSNKPPKKSSITKPKENKSKFLLKKYQEYLDDGLIKQEDYDAKKKELLGLYY